MQKQKYFQEILIILHKIIYKYGKQCYTNYVKQIMKGDIYNDKTRF